MTEAEMAVLNAALRWWRANRPLTWGERKHIDNPLVNCTSSAQTIMLAQAVAQWVEQTRMAKRADALKDKKLN
jgi:hypothetical protein